MDAFKRKIFVVLISCLSWATVKADQCYDIEGKAISFGNVYYDGNDWRICKTKVTDDQRQTTALLERKWKTLFKIYDFNHDGVVKKDDLEILKNNHIRVYELTGFKADYARGMLENFWNCIMIFTLGSGPEITEAKFLNSYKQVYWTYKEIAKKKLMDCYNDYYLPEIDVNRDGFVSFDELFKLYRAWNEGKKQFVRSIFNMMGPNEDNLVPYEHLEAFYAELSFSENNGFFDIAMNHYQAKVDPI